MAINQPPDWFNDLISITGVRCPGGKEILSPSELEAEMTGLQEGENLVIAVFRNLAESFTANDALTYLKEETQGQGRNAVIDWCSENDCCGSWAAAVAALSGATPLKTEGFKLDLEAAARYSKCQAEAGGPKFDKVKLVCIQAIQEYLRTYQK